MITLDYRTSGAKRPIELAVVITSLEIGRSQKQAYTANRLNCRTGAKQPIELAVAITSLEIGRFAPVLSLSVIKVESGSNMSFDANRGGARVTLI
ncbi:MAG TPA: hypothetical protein VIG25_26135 [Pyrinomonadaceae bacterium]